MSATTERVRTLVAPLIDDPEVVLYDVEHAGGTLRIVLDRPGGVDMGTITDVTRRISFALDEADIVPGAYTLEVSSPGLERSLRTPEHFAGALGRQVRIKLLPGTDGDRRVQGELVATEDHSITVTDADGSSRTLRLDDISKANVHVDWTPPPKPGSAPRKGRSGAPETSSTPQSEATS